MTTIAVFEPTTKTWRAATAEEAAQYTPPKAGDEVGSCGENLPAMNILETNEENYGLRLKHLQEVECWTIVQTPGCGSAWANCDYDEGKPQMVDDTIPLHAVAALTYQVSLGKRQGTTYGMKWW